MSSKVSPALLEAQARTLRRVAQIQNHFNSQTGSGKFIGKVAIITGGGSEKGIGRSTAALFAKEGAKALYILDYDATTLPAFADSLEKRYPSLTVVAVEADAADDASIAGLCDRVIKEQGRLDCFFANAGVTGNNLVMATTGAEDFMDVLRINTLSCFLAVKYGSEAMKVSNLGAGGKQEGDGGSIIFTASVAGIRSGAGPIDYSASKAAVINLANTSAQNLAGTNIRVNVVCPGLIETGMTTYTFERAKERGTLGKVGQLNPLKRFGIAEEIAPVVLFLASDDASYVNGISIPVDGGLSSSHPFIVGQAF